MSKELSQRTQRLIEQYRKREAATQLSESEDVVAVDEVAAKVAHFYERIRGVVDWREEHLLRKTAVERVLRRRLFLGGTAQDIAEPLVVELIRGGHFPNGRIPTRKIEEVRAIIAKHMALAEQGTQLTEDSRERNELENWLMAVAACEIEETLDPPAKERALIEYAAREMAEHIELPADAANLLSEEEKWYQVYVAVHRALYKLDNGIISCHLLEVFYPNWRALDRQALSEVAPRILEIKRRIFAILHHQYAENVYRLVERYDTPYLILGDVIGKNSALFPEIAADPDRLETEIREAYNKRLSSLKGKMRRAGVYSTLSIFVTKIFVVVAVEVPVDRFLFGDVYPPALVASVLIPPLLMILLVSSAKTSSAENFQRVLMEVMRITYATEKHETHYLVLPRSRQGGVRRAVQVLYYLSFLVSFGALVYVLYRFQFSPFSILVFLFFLSLVAFAGTKIRQRAEELMIGPQKAGFLSGLLDIFFLPIIQAGRWLSGHLAQYNIVVLFFNFLVETPFQVFVDLLDQWRAFLREKKEEIH